MARLARLAAICMILASAVACTTASQGIFAVPFSYASLGVGPQPMVGIVLQEGTEAAVASKAILEALQSLQYSIDPPVDLNALLPPSKPWQTGTVDVGWQQIKLYNQQFQQMSLPENRLYGVRLSGEYVVARKELRFRISAILQERGSGGSYHPYSKNYSSQFFIDPVQIAIRDRLAADARQGSAQ